MANRFLSAVGLGGAARRTVIAVPVGDRVVDVVVRRNARAKHFILRLTRAGDGAIVTVPARGSLSTARDFVTRHAGWLQSRMAAPVAAAAIAETLPLRGRTVAVRLTGATRGLVRLVETEGEAALLVAGGDHAHRRLTDHLRKEARADIEAAVARHAAALGVRPTAIHIKDTRTRWGSASVRGALNFSWRLVMAPPFVLDYVVAHEVAHLREMNHSPRFWTICRALAPRTDEARAWLTAHGAGLHRLV